METRPEDDSRESEKDALIIHVSLGQETIARRVELWI